MLTPMNPGTSALTCTSMILRRWLVTRQWTSMATQPRLSSSIRQVHTASKKENQGRPALARELTSDIHNRVTTTQHTASVLTSCYIPFLVSGSREDILENFILGGFDLRGSFMTFTNYSLFFFLICSQLFYGVLSFCCYLPSKVFVACCPSDFSTFKNCRRHRIFSFLYRQNSRARLERRKRRCCEKCILVRNKSTAFS